MSKIKSNIKISSQKAIQSNEDSNYIVQHITRIDGQETIKKYKKCGLLGKGGFANCYTTENTQTKKKAATKVIEKQLLTSQKTKLRLLNQIRLHKTLHHQNVVEFQHYFEDKDHVYIFLQLCQNTSLNELIKVRETFSTPQIQSFMYGMIKGIQYLHQKRIIHRDLKLGNVFLDEKFNIKIGDFGLATKLQFIKQCKRTVCGTPNYIAPQVLQGKGYHFQVDIWSLGVMLYTFYYGIPPFQTQDANSTYAKIKQCDYIIPKFMLVPPEAISLIQKILVKNPADRPTLQEILDSDFMKLGGKIFTQLPKVCSKKTPNKKDFTGELTFINNVKLKNIPQKMGYEKQPQKMTYEKQLQLKKNKSFPQKQKQDCNIQFIAQFEDLTEGKYFYKTNLNIYQIFQQPSKVLYRDQFGGYKAINLNQKNYAPQSCQNHILQPLLSCKSKAIKQQKVKQTVFETTLQQYKVPVFITKISKQNNFFLIRLSNKTIQLEFNDQINYLITKDCQVFQIRNGKISLIDSKQLGDTHDKENRNIISPKKLQYIKGIINQIKNKKGENEKAQKTTANIFRPTTILQVKAQNH